MMFSVKVLGSRVLSTMTWHYQVAAAAWKIANQPSVQ